MTGLLIVENRMIDQINSFDSYWAPNVSTGFLPRTLPKKPEELATSENASLCLIGLVTPKLGAMSDDELEKFVRCLPTDPDFNHLDLKPQISEAIVRAYVNIAAHLIHRPHFASRKELPSVIAKPLWDFSKYVSRPPSLTYASYVLANFTTPTRSRMKTADFSIAQTPSGTADEEWFIASHLSVESTGGEVVKAIYDIEKALQQNDVEAIVMALDSIESCMHFAAKIMPTIMDGMDADIFTYKIRPLLYGHDQIVFRGVDDDRVVTYIGETGAQSGVIKAVDAILDIQHSAEITASMDRFLMCAPPVHQRFFDYTSQLGKRLSDATYDTRISSARHSAVAALTEFRKSHLRAVASYLMPNGKKLAEYGTGGTRLTEWLKKIIDETNNTNDR